MICRRDPGLMSPADRLAELGAILAAGFRRQLENRLNSLDDRAQVERACEPEVVNSLENPNEDPA